MDRLRVYPRYQVGGAALGFPKDFVIQYAWDGDGHTCEPTNGHFADLSNWQPVLSYFGYSQPQSGWVEIAFPSKQAKCIRVLGTELSQDDYGYRYLQLSEIELYGGSVSATATQDTIVADDSDGVEEACSGISGDGKKQSERRRDGAFGQVHG